MSNPVLTLHASAARIATVTGGSVDVNRFDSCDLCVVASAVTGTNPTLDVTVQQSLDGANWFTTDSFTQLTAIGSELKKNIRVAGISMRVVGTIAGITPSFTFDCRGVFHKG